MFPWHYNSRAITEFDLSEICFYCSHLGGSRHCLAPTLSSEAASPSFHVVGSETRQNMWFHWVSTDIKNTPLPYHGKYKRHLFPLCRRKALRENTNLSAECTVENTRGNVSISRSTSLAVSPRNWGLNWTGACLLNLPCAVIAVLHLGICEIKKVQSVVGGKTRRKRTVELTRGMSAITTLFLCGFNRNR